MVLSGVPAPGGDGTTKETAQDAARAFFQSASGLILASGSALAAPWSSPLVRCSPRERPEAATLGRRLCKVVVSSAASNKLQ